MNIFDYLKWRGDITFDIDPFNYVDNLILCELIYLRYDRFIENRRYTIKELYEAYIDYCGLEKFLIDDSQWHKNILLQEVANTERFKDIEVYNYFDLKDFENTEQFTAAMYDIPDGTTYICFKGTDSTILGWKENFISTYSETAGQLEAVTYIENNYKGNKRFRIGGHSKGGYLATYAALNINDRIQDNIIEVISNDGPGLNTNVIDMAKFNRIKDRYIKIIPEDDIVGMAFDDENTNRLIVKSSKNSFNSHNSYTWLIERNHFIEGELTEKSLQIKEAFEQFILDTTPIQREKFTSSIFDIMMKNNIKKTNSIDTNNLGAYLKAIKQLAELDNENKEIAGKFLKIFTKYYENKVTSIFDRLDFWKKNDTEG